ncbi:MAG: lasso peptide biosynthesis B2 protein [Arenimonas sp.]|nr:lasso peptide biosynthesis B2 protein [Arenimonas sp.]
MGRSLAGWRALTGQQKRQLVVLATVLPAIGALIRVAGFQRAAKACARVGGQAPLRPATADDLAQAEAYAQLAAIAGRRGPVTTTCLRQALAVRTSLRRRGLDAQLKIGVKKNGETLDAHAWVELEGVALAQSQLTHHPFQGL